MPLRIVQSKQNARLKGLRQALASPGREGLIGIEGPNLVEEAMRARVRIACVFVAEGSENVVEELRVPEQTEILLVPRPLLDAALTTETPQPVAALVEAPDWTWAHVFGSHHGRTALIVILAGLQDPGNFGTILRSAEAFGATGVVSLPGTVSAWNPKTVRASAGSVFRVPLITASERDCLENLHEAGVKILATTVLAAQPVNLVEMNGPVAVIIGNEGNGIADDLAEKADTKITIPCPGPVESLNAAVAASVLLYEASRQRAAVAGGPAELRGARR
jgi:RNA methyltransferase, TrmH family